MKLRIRNSFASFSTFLVSVFLVISLQNTAYTQDNNYLLSYLSVTDGLSQNEVTSICEDKYGFMWFGTRGGLNRYDGYEFKHYKPASDKANSIQNPSIERLFVDKEGKIWIGTKSGGLNIYDPIKEYFIHGSQIIESSQDRVTAFHEDNFGDFWIGSFNNGLIRFNQENNETQHLFPNDRISSIVQTPDSIVWFGAAGNLRYKKIGNEFQDFTLSDKFYEITEIVKDPNQPYLWMVGWGLQLIRFNYQNFTFVTFPLPSLRGESINAYSLLHDKNETLWIGTWGRGLYRFDKSSEQFFEVNLNADSESAQKADYNIILDIYQDTEGAIWIGTDGGGVIKLSPSSRFNTITAFAKGLQFHVNSIYADSSNCLLVGTRGQGLYISTDRKKFVQLGIANSDLYSFIKNQNTYFIGEGLEKNVWVGLDMGIFILPHQQNTCPDLYRAGDYFQSPDLNLPNKVHDILQRGDELWVATQQMGLFLFIKSGDSFELKRQFVASHDKGEIGNNRITSLLVDKEDQLWVGTYKGLYSYNDNDSSFVSLDSLLPDSVSSLCNIILSTCLDRDNNLWFGTPCSLNKLYKETDGKFSLTEYTTKDGLPDDYISNILQDDSMNLWISSNAGISKFNTKTGEFHNFESSDGTGEYNFSETSCFKDKNGLLYFGGFSGLTYFHPDQIVYNNTIPPIAITSFKVMNKEVPVSKNGLLPISINEIDKLRLSYKEKEVSIEFAALDYKSPIRNQYAYKLEKSNELSEWVYIGSRRNISLQNLKPGDYKLYLRGSNSNGKWSNESRMLMIEVIPPPWKSWYALTSYIIIILLIVFLLIFVSLKQERLKNEARLGHVLRKQENQLNEYKLRFFTNISHEFRTPLSLILAPLKDLSKMDISVLGSDVEKKIRIATQNSNRLLKLVNQLLEFRRIEVGKAVVEASEQDIVSFLKEICQPFIELADHHGTDFRMVYEINKGPLHFDVRKMSVVMNNLLSNAFKYCGKPGWVELYISSSKNEIIVSISNNGKGISTHDQDHIFDRFYQTSSEHYHESSGIGLALVKNYLDLHKSRIEVESKKDDFTRFTFKLRKGKEHFSADEITDNSPVAIKESFGCEEKSDKTDFKFYHMGTKGRKIVIVEDNYDMAEYLSGLLSDYYEVSIAHNGKEGFDKILEIVPDLVVSDVMMPEMDGYELCKKIKSHEQISHTPVILLTAKGTPEDMLFGTKKGADDYITKPFDPELLMEKIKRNLSSRMMLENKYSKKVILEPTKMEITPDAEKLLNSALKIIENNIASPDLNLDFLASEMAMSGTTLYRKMKVISDLSPGEFIRSIRFKRAAQLFRDTDLTVSEIIEMVGYLDIKRFRETFRTEFGLTPSEYRKLHREDS